MALARFRFRPNTPAIVVALLLVPGLFFKSAYEESLDQMHQTLKYGSVRNYMALEMRQKFPQYIFIAVLSGFRGTVADLLWISAHTDWQNRLWYRMEEKMDLVTLLQPQSIHFWVTSAWHKAWNFSYAASVDPEEPRAAVRFRNQKIWIERGRKTLEEGIRNNPNSARLYEEMGRLLKEKEMKYAEAARFYGKAASFPGAPLYLARQEAYCYYEAGRYPEAYRMMAHLWRGNPAHHVLTLRTRIRELEERLGIPPEKRIFPNPP